MGIWIAINVILYALLPFYIVIFFKDEYAIKKIIVFNLMFILLMYGICAWQMKILYSGILLIFLVASVYYIGAYIIYKDKIKKIVDKKKLISIWNNKAIVYTKIIITLISILVLIGNIIFCKRNIINVESISLCVMTLLGMVELIVELNSKFVYKE